MAILEHEVRSVSGAEITGLSRRLFSRAEYQALADKGVLANQRLELIEGEIIQMAPIGYEHASMTNHLAELLKTAFGSEHVVRTQVPISIGSDDKPSEPQPDIAVAVGSWRDYLDRHPQAKDVKLVIEIADSSLATDRKTKAALYAVDLIPEFWIVNLAERQLEVYRQPSDGIYRSVTALKVDEFISPIGVLSSISVRDFMP